MTETSTQPDGDLLASFVATDSETAFSELVYRHGPMVRRVCQRVLSDRQEAEDVAQAVFLTLARKARGLRKDPSIGGWLHHVAWCLALNVRKARDRRHRHEEAAMREMNRESVQTVDVAAFLAEPLAKAVAKWVDAIRINDPQHAPVSIKLNPPIPSMRLQFFTLLTMDSGNIPTTATQILQGIAEMTDQQITFSKDRVILSPSHPDKTTVVVPEISFKEAPVSEAVVFLQSVTGVKIKLIPRAGTKREVTLSGKGMRLDNIVLTIASQTGLAMGFEEDGLVLK